MSVMTQYIFWSTTTGKLQKDSSLYRDMNSHNNNHSYNKNIATLYSSPLNIYAVLVIYHWRRESVNIRIATKTKWPSRWMYYVSNACISTKTGTSVLMKAYLWSTSVGKGNWSINGRQRHWQGTKPKVAKSRIVLITCIYIFHYGRTLIL